MPIHMFVSVSYMKQGGFKREMKVCPCAGQTFFLKIKLSESLKCVGRLPTAGRSRLNV